MKIAVTSAGPTLDDNVESRFGRCAYFLIIDTDTMQFEAIENPNIALGGGAGIQSAQLMSEKGVTTILTGNCGPNAFNVFGQAGIQVIVGVNGIVGNAVEQFKAGGFSSASAPNVASHFGMNATPTVPTATGQPGINPMGQGVGGAGFGMGGGRGGGMGRGMGRGGGRGRGMGMGGFFGMSSFPGTSTSAAAANPDSVQEIEALKQQAQQLEEQNQQIARRIAELQTGQQSIAVVLPEKCIGCGICADVCPADAIKVNGQAVVQPALCTGCGRCVSECPNGAIILASPKKQ